MTALAAGAAFRHMYANDMILEGIVVATGGLAVLLFVLLDVIIDARIVETQRLFERDEE